MLKSKIMSRIIVFGVLILLIFTCGCSNGGTNNTTTPSDSDTTPSETSTARTTQIETTPAETTMFESPYPFPEVEPMPDELRLQVEASYVAANDQNKFYGWLTPENVDGGVRYYGTYGDVVVMFESGVTDALTRKYIADSLFEFGAGFSLYAYHDGNLIDLQDAYEQQLISVEDIKKVADIHDQFNRWRLYWMY